MESVIGYGTVEEVMNEREKLDGLEQIMAHYSPAHWDLPQASVEAVRVWKMPIDTVTGKQS